ncbi:penicillin binding protein 1C [Legionella busanensis]|uniref:peptidoglycan glycosyltransferase n=1 Tax=Legionella busanensis TaxID=190655 RepID=A0A378JLD8_9GAMM|nr:penicillin-binding protein 1C [Legionella busanensis]STX51508.1 penicillin binding protein 1C [Legionella busanensis]
MKYFFTRFSLIFLFSLILGYAFLYFLPAPPLLKHLDFSTVVYDDKQQLLRLTLNKEDKYRVFTPLKQIAPTLVAATLLQEDQYFYFHHGINPLALIKATWKTYFEKSRRIGASTITMQVARLRFGINSKKISGKVIQIIRALQLEIHYSKDQLLEAYLNLAPYGNNIEGVGAASLIYFNKSTDKINLPEALTLAVMPQNPSKRTPQNKDLIEIRNKLFHRWLVLHPKDKKYTITINLPLEMRSIHSLPFLAPHFVNSILRNNSPRSKAIHTTLNSDLQQLLERITKNYIQRKYQFGVYNAAVLLVDVRDMSIKGSVGSADFFNKAISGQINGTEAKRSPGSTLKPFVYGLAFDQGLIHPHTVLKDVPSSFGHYNPENFDYDFMGPIKAKDALIFSRNIPAIYLANQLTHPTLYDLLNEAHVTHLKSESFYGLALTLGGAELSMRELASLYAMLANDGLWRPIRSYQDENIHPGKRMLSPEASFLVLEILKETPYSTTYATKYNLYNKVAWKTGTSSGYRDAWTAGIVGPYVLVTWIGNFDNKSNPAFVGKNIAAPLFFELIDAIKHVRGNFSSLPKNINALNLTKIDVCKASGLLPTRFCRDTEQTWFIPGKSPIQTDNIYREVAINKLTGLRTCHFNENTRFEIYEFWPSDLLAIFRQAGIARRIPPRFEANCALTSTNTLKPQITSPQTDLHYIFRISGLQKTAIPFSAVTDADIKTLYWFINDSFLTKTRSNETYFWQAKPGNFVVRVVDDHGFSDARNINIKVE